MTKTHFAHLAIAIFLALVAFGNSVESLTTRWLKFDEAYGHGFLIVALSMFMAFEHFKHKKHAFYLKGEGDFYTGRTLYALFFCLAGLSFAWFIGAIASLTLPQQLLLPLLLLGLALILTPKRDGKALIFPVLFLYFAIPLWDQLNDLLVHVTVIAVTQLLAISDIAAYIEDNYVEIVSGRFIVAGSCSGLRYLVVGGALSCFAAYSHFRTHMQKLLYVAAGIAISISANWVRVYLLILIGHETEMQSSLMQEHDHFGWLVFFVMFAPMFLIVWRYGAQDENTPELGTDAERSTKYNEQSISTRHKPSTKRLFATVSAMLVGPILYLSVSHASTASYTNSLAFDDKAFVKRSSGTSLITLPESKSKSGFAIELERITVEVETHNYGKHTFEDKLVPYIANVYDRDTWHKSAQKRIQNESLVSNDIQQREITHNRTGRKATLWYWYEVGGVTTSSYRVAKLLQIAANLTGKNNASVFAMSSLCDLNCEAENIAITTLLESARIETQSTSDMEP